ncbi:lysophosphatidic acid receptor 6-like [Sphaerodactylus townsendi]|uniref:lysophosphatidic acid receptor 6-like n=1 Tax=Sphaerodactylus townsendi TaxID=933632 RepID=UPI00202703C1|nr:lysophosphatidic acid receptor 6-like [Sphaerodactylus townsendi]
MEGGGPSNLTLANASSECLLQADFQYSFFPAVYSTVFVLGLLENVAALYLLTCKTAGAPRSFVYLINLAVVDTLFVCVLPFKIHYHLHRNDWIFGDVACRVTGSMYFVNIYLSVAFFTCICVDRYVAVLHPFAYIRIKGGHYGVVCALLWVVAMGVAIPLVLGGPLTSRKSNRTACFESFRAGSWGRMVPYNVCALVFGFAIPFVVILISYPLIARRISRIPRSARKRKALGTIYLILLICVTCFLPYHLTHLLHFLMRAGLLRTCRFATFIYKMRRVTLALVSFNCCLNPILYYFTSARKRWRCQLPLKTRATKVYTVSGGQNCNLPYAGEVRQPEDMGAVTLLKRATVAWQTLNGN